MTQQPQLRFLIVKIGALGDLFFALPAVSYLRQHFPGCKIDWLTSESFAPLLRGHPEITNVYTLNEKDLFNGSSFDKAKAVSKFRSRLNQKFDHIFLLHRSIGYLAALYGKGPISMVSRSKNDFNMAGVQFVSCPPLVRHESLNIKRVLEAGIHRRDSKIELSLYWQAELGYLRQKGQTPRFIGLHIGGGKNVAHEFVLKKWPYFGQLLPLLLEKTNHEIKIIGAPDEIGEALQILEMIPHHLKSRVHNLVGKTDLVSLAAEISTCSIFVGPDSGPLHIADMMDIASVGIYGPTSPISWGLLKPSSSRLFIDPLICRPCYKDDGDFPSCWNFHKCMKDLSPLTVSLAVEDLVRRQSLIDK
ncbi:MAG: glycosyltransferase family 9 protein [Bdellovibrio sp.]